MNYQGQPATVNYGESNNVNQDPLQQQEEQIQQKEPTQQQVPLYKEPKKITKYMYLANILKSILNTKSGTILATAIGIAIGAGFKDLVTSFMSNVIQPIIIGLLVISDVNNIYNLSQYVTPQSNALNLSNFLISLFSFFILCISTYYISDAINMV